MLWLGATSIYVHVYVDKNVFRIIIIINVEYEIDQ